MNTSTIDEIIAAMSLDSPNQPSLPPVQSIDSVLRAYREVQAAEAPAPIEVMTPDPPAQAPEAPSRFQPLSAPPIIRPNLNWDFTRVLPVEALQSAPAVAAQAIGWQDVFHEAAPSDEYQSQVEPQTMPQLDPLSLLRGRLHEFEKVVDIRSDRQSPVPPPDLSPHIRAIDMTSGSLQPAFAGLAEAIDRYIAARIHQALASGMRQGYF